MSAISKSISPAFIKHLSFFASPQRPDTITLLSAIKSSLSLGFNFPASVLLSLTLRILYSPSWPIPIQPPNLQRLGPTQQRTMLELSDLPSMQSKKSFSRADLLALIPSRQDTWVNRGHIIGLWALAADNSTARVHHRDVQNIQDGSLVHAIQQRRKIGRTADVVLPFRRGGPGNVAGHSWVVEKLFGVKVYVNDSKES